MRLGCEVDDRLAPGGRARDGVGSAMSPTTNSWSIPSRFAGLPAYVSLSSTTTSSPPATSRLTKCDPIKPAPPVTRTRIATGYRLSPRRPPEPRSVWSARYSLKCEKIRWPHFGRRKRLIEAFRRERGTYWAHPLRTPRAAWRSHDARALRLLNASRDRDSRAKTGPAAGPSRFIHRDVVSTSHSYVTAVTSEVRAKKRQRPTPRELAGGYALEQTMDARPALDGISNTRSYGKRAPKREPRDAADAVRPRHQLVTRRTPAARTARAVRSRFQTARGLEEPGQDVGATLIGPSPPGTRRGRRANGAARARPFRCAGSKTRVGVPSPRTPPS